MRTTFLALLLLLEPDAALACGRAELRAFMEAAQQLDARAEQLGPALLACPDETAEAAQWLAFYRAVKTPPPKPAPATRAVSARTATSLPGEVGRAIVAAYAGAYGPLRAKLDAGEPLYRDTPEAALAVGRMLVRERRFEDGRRYYEDFLRVRDGAAEEAEYLYTFIWQGDLARAEQELASVRGDAYLTAAARRGLQLVARLRGSAPTPPAATRTGAKRSPLLTGGAEAFVVKDQLHRYGSLLRYRGLVDASWRHHLVKVLVYDQPTLNTDELRIGREQPLGDYLTLAASAAFVAHADRHWGGEALARFQLPGSIGAAVGAERRHLYATLPLAETALSLTQDRLWAELGWDRRFVLRSARLKDDGGEPFEEHELDVRQPVGGAATLLATAGYAARALPSPNYETYRKTQRLGVGGAFERPVAERWNGELEAMYVLRVRQPYGDEKYLRHSGLELKAELGTMLGESLRLAGHVTYAAEETERPTGKVEHRLGVAAAVQLVE